MLKRAVTIAVIGLSLLALVPAAQAHLAGTIRGIHYASIVCIDDISGVPGTALGTDPSKPAKVVCTVFGRQVEILCTNPAGHEVAPGNAATQITVSTEDQIDDDDIVDKKKGVASKTIEVSDQPFLDRRFCVNPNWNPIEVLVTDIRVTVEVKQCADSTCDPQKIITTSREVQDCVIPAGYSVVNLPPVGTEYECTPVSKQHLK